MLVRFLTFLKVWWSRATDSSSPAAVGGTKLRVRCNWFRFASMECVSFMWLAIEVSTSDTSVERDRREERRRGGASALRPRWKVNWMDRGAKIAKELTMPYGYVS